MLNQLRLAQKLWLAVALMATALIATMVFSGHQSTKIQTLNEEVTKEMRWRIEAAQQWVALAEKDTLLSQAILLGDAPVVEAALKEELAATAAELVGLPEQIRARSLTSQDQAQLEKIAIARNQVLETQAQARQLRNAGNHEEALAWTNASYKPASANYLAALRQFVQMQQESDRIQRQQIAAARVVTVRIAIGSALGVLVFMLCGAWFLIRSIQQPLAQAMGLTERIATGDLSAQNTVLTRGDEFGHLLRTLYSMSMSLESIVYQVRQSTDSIATASDEIAQGNHDLSARTEQTSSNLQKTAAAMEQFTSTIQQSAHSAQQASSLANGAANVARKGGEVVSQVASTMQDIQHSSSKIANIISVIDGIAFQTNILALNAAVEAARAGEQGRGFAVVASEVRSLAGSSADAAKEIKQLIGVSVAKIETGSDLVQQAGSTMKEIVQSVQRVTDIIGEITAASTEQSGGVAQVNQAVGHLDQMTQQNAALVEQSAAAAQSLREQAQHLAGVVSQFKVHGDATIGDATPPSRSPASATKAS